MCAILKTVAILDLKMAEMDSLGQTTLKSIYYSTLYVNLQGNYPVFLYFGIYLAAILFFPNLNVNTSYFSFGTVILGFSRSKLP